MTKQARQPYNSGAPYDLELLRVRSSYNHIPLHALITAYIATCHYNRAFIDDLGLIPYMDLRQCMTGYHEPDDTHYDKNPWDNYFIQPAVRVNQLFCREFMAANGGLVHYQKPEDYYQYKKTAEKYLHIKPEILKKVDQFVKNHFDDDTVAIHIRGTDSFITNDRPHLPLAYYRDLIREKLANKRIFLSTDSKVAQQLFLNMFPGQVVCYSADKMPEDIYYCNLSWNHGLLNNRGYKHGEDVLIESILMSRCNMLIRTFSNVNSYSLVLNPDIKSHQIDLKCFYDHNYTVDYNYIINSDYSSCYIEDLEVANHDQYRKAAKEFAVERNKLSNNYDALKNLVQKFWYKDF